MSRALRILLVRTSMPRGSRSPFDYPPVAQPLGIMHVAASLRRARPGDPVRLVDAAVELGSLEDLGPLLDSFRPDVLGLSALGYEEPLYTRIARMARAWNPSMPVVLGGPAATADPARALSHEEVDYAVVGEGELTFPDLVNHIADGRSPSSVRGIALRDPEGRPRLTPRRPFVQDLDGLPPVDWGDIHLERYEHLLNINDFPPRGRLALILTSRGCPYRCTYCHCFYGRKVRAWSRSRLGDEIETLVRDHLVGEIHIADDIFNANPRRIRDLHHEIASRGLDVRLAFPNGLRGDKLSGNDIDLLSRAGCHSFCLAIESTSERIQGMIRKKLDVEKVFRAAEHASLAGIVSQAFVMIGFPTETRQEMVETVERTSASAFDLVRVFPVIPYPGTDLYEDAVRHGFDPSKLGRLYMEDGTLVNATSLPDDEYRDLIRWARTRAYEDPGRIERLRAIHRASPDPGHPLFLRGQWQQVLGA